MQHILDRLSTLSELVKHHDHRLAGMEPEPSVRIVAGSLGVVVNDRHSDVTQVHVRHVDVRHAMLGEHSLQRRHNG